MFLGIVLSTANTAVNKTDRNAYTHMELTERGNKEVNKVYQKIEVGNGERECWRYGEEEGTAVFSRLPFL